MYGIRPNVVIGFHGCDEDVRDALLTNPHDIQPSEKPYDWLGNGVYFWENDPYRAMEWAKRKEERGEIKKASIIGAVLYLGHCCDFLDRGSITTLASFYELMELGYAAIGKKMPINKDVNDDEHQDKLLRYLDCAAIEYMHEKMLEDYQEDITTHGISNRRLFDSARGVFTEGGEAFPGAGLAAKSHIQICIRNLNCIKGFFLPRQEEDFYTKLADSYNQKKLKAQ